jgi:hypothetical protein
MFGKLRALHARHDDVADDQVDDGIRVSRQGHGLLAIARKQDFVARLGEHAFDEPSDLQLVLDDQDGFAAANCLLVARSGGRTGWFL